MAKQPVQKILRVGLFQNQRLLEERHMRKPSKVTIGSDFRKNTLVVPASKVPSTFLLFDVSGGSYTLHFAEAMKGKVSRDGRVETLEELRRSGAAKKKGEVYVLPLKTNQRGRVEIGEATVVFQFVTPPPVRPVPVLPASMRGGLIHGMDRHLALLILLSALIQVGFVVFLQLQDFPDRRDQEFKIPDRMARIMVPEEEQELDPVEVDDTPGDEPTDEPDPDPQPVAEERTPEEVAEQRHEERLEVTQRIEETTIIGTLAVESEDGIGVVQRLVADVRDITADEAFEGTTRVETGSGVRGDRLGRGGGSPDASGGIAEGEELGQMGGVGQRVETGERAETTVERVAVQMDAGAPDDMVGGTLDTAALTRALRSMQRSIEACYQDYLRTNPSASGTVRILLTISAQGSRGVVRSAEVALDEVAGGRVGTCIANQLRAGRVRLPAPEGADTQVTIPFHFSPGS